MPTKSIARQLHIPSVCPRCDRPIRKFRSILAVVAGSPKKKLEAAHFHLSFAGICGGIHLHICANCSQRFTTLDPNCNWSEPIQHQPGWTIVKASQCECEKLESEEAVRESRKRETINEEDTSTKPEQSRKNETANT